MGLTGASLNRFGARVDAVLDDAFPCKLLIRGKPVVATGTGNRVASDYDDGGERLKARFPFRVPASAFSDGFPKIGEALSLELDSGRVLDLEIIEYSVRTAEDKIPIVCRFRLR